jgi:hypothetical protein
VATESPIKVMSTGTMRARFPYKVSQAEPPQRDSRPSYDPHMRNRDAAEVRSLQRITGSWIPHHSMGHVNLLG